MSPITEFRPTFVQIPYGVFADKDLSHAAKLVYGRLLLYAGKDGLCYPKQETLAAEICIRHRQLRTVLVELRDQGWLTWCRIRTGCAYRVILDRQKTAGSSGRKLPVAPAENCRSRSAENCRQNRSIENHHQKEVLKEQAPRPARTPPHPPNLPQKTPAQKILKVDDEKPKPSSEPPLPPIQETPETELRNIFHTKTGTRIGQEVERRVWEAVELRGVARSAFIDQLRPHVANRWKNPAGFLTNFARKVTAMVAADPAPPTINEPPKNAKGRCSVCGGGGYTHWEAADIAARKYCECSMGRDLQVLEQRPTRKTAEIAGSQQTGESKCEQTA